MACSQEYRRILKSRKHASTSQPEDGLASDEETSWQWTEWEDELVITNRVAGKTYGEISRLLPSRTANAVAARWNNHLQKRRLEDTFTASENRWSQQEDQLLVSLHIAGEKFAEIAQKIPNRSVSSCRTRWQKLVGCRPELLKRWTILEKNTLESLFNILGPRWHDIAKELPGRTHQACERHYYHELDCGDKVEASGPSREDWISHWNNAPNFEETEMDATEPESAVHDENGDDSLDAEESTSALVSVAPTLKRDQHSRNYNAKKGQVIHVPMV